MFMKRLHLLIAIRATVLCAFVMASPALAQDTPESPPGTPDGTVPGVGLGKNWSWHPDGNTTPAGGTNGANRVVSKKGYGAVSGSFSEPSHGLNPESTGRMGGVPNQKTNKTSFYLGGKTSDNLVTIDAGVQWEPESAVVLGETYDPGWSVFSNADMTVRLPQRGRGRWRYSGNPKPPWRVEKGELKTTQLGYELDSSGRVTITANVANKGEQGNKSVGPLTVLWPSNLSMSNMEVRRVLALTQAYGEDQETGYALITGADGTSKWESKRSTLVNFDGSWVHNLTFVNGKVAKFTVSNGVFTKVAEDVWTAPNTEALILPKGKNQDGPWIIDFPAPWKRSDDELGKHTPGYSQESVNIDVWKKPSAVDGRSSKGARRYPFD